MPSGRLIAAARSPGQGRQEPRASASEVPLALYRTDHAVFAYGGTAYPSVPIRTPCRIGIEWMVDMTRCPSDESEGRRLTVSSP